MNLIKRTLATLLITVGLTIILLGLASAAGILVVIACPFLAVATGVNFFEQTRGTANV
jgi:hypothetical protein